MALRGDEGEVQEKNDRDCSHLKMQNMHSPVFRQEKREGMKDGED
jgi:hypothetical protein